MAVRRGAKTKPVLAVILRRFTAAFLLTALSLFAPAGTFHWWNAWVLLFFTAMISVLTGNLFHKLPELLEERMNAADKAKPWDKVIVPLVGLILPLSAIVLAGLDKRLGWTRSITVWESFLAVPVMVGGMLLTFWAMKSNPFFSSYVRIQKNRGHRVASSGPYRLVRHPGYTGIILFNLAVPILLGSWIAFGAGVAVVLLTILRTTLEDLILRKELKGYREYTVKVPYRLFPLVW